jgi:nicotinamide-nucleotide amidase
MNIEQLSKAIGEKLLAQNMKLTTAESCTGGLVSAAITEVPGSSAWFGRGFVTYSNEAKIAMLDVMPEMLAEHGAVSEAVAEAMAKGALQYSLADVAVAITGIAGPSGGTDDKPVGTVCFAWAFREQSTATITQNFIGNRQAVRRQATLYCLQELLSLIPS